MSYNYGESMSDFEISIRNKIEILSRSITYLTTKNTSMEDPEIALLTDALEKLEEILDLKD